jgi:hypothetical protein
VSFVQIMAALPETTTQHLPPAFRRLIQVGFASDSGQLGQNRPPCILQDNSSPRPSSLRRIVPFLNQA